MTNDGVVPERSGLFEGKPSASAPGLKSRGTRSGWGSLRMAVLTPLLFCAGLEPAYAGQKALLIGAGEYPYLPDEKQLDGPHNDVRSMKAFLVNEWGFSDSDVSLILDKEATKQGMLDALGDWLPGATRPGDRVVIYYSGHGSQVPDTNGDERDGKDETFVPTDYGRNGDRAEDMLLDDELANALNRLRDRQVLLIADTCHSGNVTKNLQVDGLNAKPRYLPFGKATKGIVRDEGPISEDINVHLTLSAVLPHQLAWELDGSGIFTKLFIKALTDMRADRNGNGRLTTAELINYVKPRTESWCERVPECRKEGLGFTPNLDPKNETFVLQPVATGGQPVVTQEDAGAISDILPALGNDTIDIDIRPGNRLRIGNKVSIRLTSTKDGHLTLLDRNAKNELTLLFPTQVDFEKGISDRIWAHRPLTVPDKSHRFTFTAQEPAGPGELIAIVTNDRVDLDSLLAEYRGFELIENKLDLMRSIAARLYAVWTGEKENRGAQWAVAYADYVISGR